MKVKISRFQLFLLIPNLIFGKAIGITSGVMCRKIGADTWISMIMGFIIGTVTLVILIYISSKFPEKTLIAYSEELLGKWAGKAIGVLMICFFITAYATSANVMGLHLKDYFLAQTPYRVICFVYTTLCAFGVFTGIEVILRFSLIGLIMLMSITIFMITGTIGDFKLINLQPLMDKGFINDLNSSIYLFTDLAFAIFTIGVLYPMLNNKKKFVKISLSSMLLTALMVIVWPFFEVGVMGPSIMNKFVVVCMEQIRCAQLTKYFPRYELIMVFFYTFSIFVQSSVLFYCGTHCIKQLMGLKKDRYIILSMIVILSTLSYYMGHHENQYVNFLSYPWPHICAILSIGLIFILFLSALIRGKLKKQTH